MFTAPTYLRSVSPSPLMDSVHPYTKVQKEKTITFFFLNKGVSCLKEIKLNGEYFFNTIHFVFSKPNEEKAIFQEIKQVIPAEYTSDPFLSSITCDFGKIRVRLNSIHSEKPDDVKMIMDKIFEILKSKQDSFCSVIPEINKWIQDCGCSSAPKCVFFPPVVEASKTSKDVTDAPYFDNCLIQMHAEKKILDLILSQDVTEENLLKIKSLLNIRVPNGVRHLFDSCEVTRLTYLPIGCFFALKQCFDLTELQRIKEKLILFESEKGLKQGIIYKTPSNELISLDDQEKFRIIEGNQRTLEGKKKAQFITLLRTLTAKNGFVTDADLMEIQRSAFEKNRIMDKTMAEYLEDFRPCLTDPDDRALFQSGALQPHVPGYDESYAWSAACRDAINEIAKTVSFKEILSVETNLNALDLILEKNQPKQISFSAASISTRAAENQGLEKSQPNQIPLPAAPIPIKVAENQEILSAVETNPVLSEELIQALAEATDRDTIERILQQGGCISGVNKFAWTALHFAARSGRENVVRALIDSGAVVDKPDKDGFTPLYLAAGQGHRNIVHILIEAGARMDTKSPYGTPFLNAVEKGHVEVVSEFISKNVFVGVKSHRKRTALHIAVAEGHEALVRVLLPHMGKLFQEKDRDGQTALDIAKQEDQKEIIRILESFVC